jgi:hypothetical protein
MARDLDGRIAQGDIGQRRRKFSWLLSKKYLKSSVINLHKGLQKKRAITEIRLTLAKRSIAGRTGGKAFRSDATTSGTAFKTKVIILEHPIDNSKRILKTPKICHQTSSAICCSRKSDHQRNGSDRRIWQILAKESIVNRTREWALRNDAQIRDFPIVFNTYSMFNISERNLKTYHSPFKTSVLRSHSSDPGFIKSNFSRSLPRDPLMENASFSYGRQDDSAFNHLPILKSSPIQKKDPSSSKSDASQTGNAYSMLDISERNLKTYHPPFKTSVLRSHSPDPEFIKSNFSRSLPRDPLMENASFSYGRQDDSAFDHLPILKSSPIQKKDPSSSKSDASQTGNAYSMLDISERNLKTYHSPFKTSDLRSHSPDPEFIKSNFSRSLPRDPLMENASFSYGRQDDSASDHLPIDNIRQFLSYSPPDGQLGQGPATMMRLPVAAQKRNETIASHLLQGYGAASFAKSPAKLIYELIRFLEHPAAHVLPNTTTTIEAYSEKAAMPRMISEPEGMIGVHPSLLLMRSARRLNHPALFWPGGRPIELTHAISSPTPDEMQLMNIKKDQAPLHMEYEAPIKKEAIFEPAAKGVSIQENAAPQLTALDLGRITDRIYDLLEQKMTMERERRGLYV